MRLTALVPVALVGLALAPSAVADPGDDDVATDGAGTDDTCPAGDLGSVEGAVLRFTSDGSRVFFVAQGNDGVARIGVLDASGTSTTLAAEAAATNAPLAAVEGGVATAVGQDEIRFWNTTGRASAVERAATDGAVAEPYADANGLLHWYEYDRRYGTSFWVWNGSSVTSTDAPSNFEGGSFVTDGRSYFGAFSAPDGGHAIGKLATSGDHEVVFATVHRAGAPFAFAGMDADDVYYVLQTDDGVVRFAGSERSTGATTDYGAKLGLDATRPLVVRDGFVYVAGASAQDPTAAITRFDLATGVASTVASGPLASGAVVTGPLVADACGIVYAVRRSQGGAITTDFVRIAP